MFNKAVSHFADRTDAGKRLAEKLSEYANKSDVVILALPRGGVPVGYEVAKKLNVTLDILLVRKLGVPGHTELAMGAIASNDVRVLNEQIVRRLTISNEMIASVTETAYKELQRREAMYRGDHPRPKINNQIVILVDDGLATGATMSAAVNMVKQQNPAKVVVAVPTAAPETCRKFEEQVDEVVCDITPEPFISVGSWYANFSQTTDQTVRELLEKTRANFA